MSSIDQTFTFWRWVTFNVGKYKSLIVDDRYIAFYVHVVLRLEMMLRKALYTTCELHLVMSCMSILILRTVLALTIHPSFQHTSTFFVESMTQHHTGLHSKPLTFDNPLLLTEFRFKVRRPYFNHLTKLRCFLFFLPSKARDMRTTLKSS